MTLELELRPEIEEKLNQRSEAQGTSLENVVASIIESDVARQETKCPSAKSEEKSIARFLELAEKLGPEIQAGLARPLSSDDVTALVHDARREEEERLLVGFGANEDEKS